VVGTGAVVGIAVAAAVGAGEPGAIVGALVGGLVTAVPPPQAATIKAKTSTRFRRIYSSTSGVR
jgi:hypothetical protein